MKFFQRICDFLGRLGDEVTFVKPDTKRRDVTLARCYECGLTQLVEVFSERPCAGCGHIVMDGVDSVGEPEVIN